MGKKPTIVCPHCSSQKIKRNGHHYGKKLQFFCHSCGKYFSEDVARGYPTTKIPFPIIAYLLYFRKRIPAFSNMRVYRKFVSNWLKCLCIRDIDVDRHTIRYWIKNYESILEQIINFQETCDFVHGILSDNIKDLTKEDIRAKTHPYKQTLQILGDFFGRSFCVDLARTDPVFFRELADIVSKKRLYCHLTVQIEGNRSGQSAGLFFRGVVQ